MYKITVPSLGITYYQENLAYVKYQEKNNLMLLCGREEAQGILSKDNSEIFQFNEADKLKEEYPLCYVEEVSADERFEQVETQAKETEAQTDELSLTVDSILTEVLPSLIGM